jgi:hypothetical protein
MPATHERSPVPPEVETADAIQKALATAGLVNSDGTAVICPGCGKSAPIGNKFKIFPDGGYKHFGANGCHGNAITILRTRFDCTFGDAIRFLQGKRTRFTFPEATVIPITVKKFTAKRDIGLNQLALNYLGHTRIKGDKLAIAVDSLHHIIPEATLAYGCVGAPDPDQFNRDFFQRCGEQRVEEGGWAYRTKSGDLRGLVSEDYNFLEVHHHPDGSPYFVQLKASGAKREKIRLNEQRGGKYIGGKFLSLRGIPRELQLGTGLHVIAKAAPGSRVVVVEGGKDARSAYTMGALAYGIPGVDYRPGDIALDTLKTHRVDVMLDGDDAGNAHAEELAQHLRDGGVKHVSVRKLPDGQDVNDILVDRHTTSGCTCIH